MQSHLFCSIEKEQRCIKEAHLGGASPWTHRQHIVHGGAVSCELWGPGLSCLPPLSSSGSGLLPWDDTVRIPSSHLQEYPAASMLGFSQRVHNPSTCKPSLYSFLVSSSSWHRYNFTQSLTKTREKEARVRVPFFTRRFALLPAKRFSFSFALCSHKESKSARAADHPCWSCKYLPPGSLLMHEKQLFLIVFRNAFAGVSH